MKKQVDTLDAVPSKRLFLSIIADYDVNKSICELIDNGFDVWTRSGRASPIHIEVQLSAAQNFILVKDNAGGLPKDELRNIVGPGHSGSSTTDQTIGIFGVGTKRAVVALSQDIKIRTRYTSERTYQVEFDESWLHDEDWSLPLFIVDDIASGTTEVELQKLRVEITGEVIEHLREHLSATYANLLEKKDVSLKLNGVRIQSKKFDDWSYPPGYEPRSYSGTLETPSSSVTVRVVAGLSAEASPTLGEYGVYFYCNDRLVAPAMKTFDVGFTPGQAGNPHPKISLTKVIVSLQGEAGDMPWNSSKSDINTKHETFLALHDWLIKVVGDFAKVSRGWMGQWPEKVYAYPTGNIVEVGIENFLTARKSYLPDPPKSRPRLAERVEIKNRKDTAKRPWIRELYEGVVAASAVSKQPLKHANWFAYNLLDLTMRAAFKTYLTNEAAEDLDVSLKRVLKLTPKIPEELRMTIPLPDETWDDVLVFSKNLDRLKFASGSSLITDADLAAAEDLVIRILSALFKIELEASAGG